MLICFLLGVHRSWRSTNVLNNTSCHNLGRSFLQKYTLLVHVHILYQYMYIYFISTCTYTLLVHIHILYQYVYGVVMFNSLYGHFGIPYSDNLITVKDIQTKLKICVIIAQTSFQNVTFPQTSFYNVIFTQTSFRGLGVKRL